MKQGDAEGNDDDVNNRMTVKADVQRMIQYFAIKKKIANGKKKQSQSIYNVGNVE